MSIAKIYRRGTVCIAPSSSVREAAETMRREHVGALVVAEGAADGRRPLGIVTDRDIVVGVIAAGVDSEAVTVAEMMSAAADPRELVTAGLDDDLFAAVHKMRVHRVRRLPVVDTQGCLVGIVSLDDVLEALAEMLADLATTVRGEEEREWQQRP